VVILLGRFTVFLTFWDWGIVVAAWLTALVPKLNTPLAFLLGWLLACLGVCALLSLWLKKWRVAAAVTLILALVWIVGTFRYAQGTAVPETIAFAFEIFGIPPIIGSTLIMIVLTIGVLVLPALWFLQPTLGPTVTLVWLMLWLMLTFGLRERGAGAVLIFSLAASCTVFLLGLYVTSGFLLPLPGKEHRGKVFGFWRAYLMRANFPSYVVMDEPYEEDKVEQRISGNMFNEYAPGPGFVLSDCDHAVAISDGIKFKGVQEPGVIFTGYADHIVRTVDLRPQLRVFHVEALTRDGIKIRVLAFTPFKIDSRGRQPRLGEHLPYNKSAAFKAVHAQRVEHEANEKEQCSWDELPPMIARRILQNIISEYDFDSLYGPYQSGGEPPRRIIAREFCKQVAKELEPLGIQLIGGGISDLEPAEPQEVYLKRARSWQAEWTRKITLKRAKGQTEWLRTVERVRAEAQADLILNLGRQLEELSMAGTKINPQETLNLLTSVLDGLTSQHPEMGQLLPKETLETLAELRKVIP
jgi:hypothetical protein